MYMYYLKDNKHVEFCMEFLISFMYPICIKTVDGVTVGKDLRCLKTSSSVNDVKALTFC